MYIKENIETLRERVCNDKIILNGLHRTGCHKICVFHTQKSNADHSFKNKHSKRLYNKLYLPIVYR